MTSGIKYTSTKPLEKFECHKNKDNTAEETISILSDIRSNYNCFNENEEPKYRALSKAIEALKAQQWIPDKNEEKCDHRNCPVQYDKVDKDCDLKECPYRTVHRKQNKLDFATVCIARQIGRGDTDGRLD